MNKKQLLLAVSVACLSPFISAETIDQSIISKITIQSSNDSVSINENTFKDTVKQNLITNIANKLDTSQKISIFGDSKSWEALSGSADGTHLLRFSISSNQFTKGKLKIEGAEHASLYLNASHVSGNNTFDVELLNQDYRALVIVSGATQWQDFSISWEGDESANVVFADDNDKKRASMKQYYDSQTVGALNLSPNGEFLVWSKAHYSDLGGDTAHSVYEIMDLDSQQAIYRWQAMTPRHISWHADSKSLVFIHNKALYQLDIKTKELTELATDLGDVRSVHWLSDNELVVSWHKAEDNPHAFTKRYRALEDRWSYWRGDLQIHKFDVQSGLFKQITQNGMKSNLLDINKKDRTALLTRRPIDYSAPPHGLSQLIEVNLDTGEEKTIGEYRTFSSAQYHEDGVLVVAGPSFSDQSGINLINEPVANDYDGQLYLMSKQGEVTALSKEFDPAINQVSILNNGDLIVLVSDEDRRQLFKYDISDQAFSKIAVNVDVVSGFTVSDESRPALVYKGTNATIPQRVYATNLRARKQTELFSSVKTDFANVELTEIKDWDYTSESGQFIDGRVYYPAGFDENKSYPAIVYYYGGTVPVTRGFTGRWPFSLWASKGYVVYVLQPSGTTGYGQDFSARHVNAWGINTADEIIESTRAFVDAHPFVDKNRLGNMGASYGGFMTMYLTTQTELFAASISHAGISNLTSYWGEGWWGYGYSGVATRGSFPWNSTDLYIQQSPIFAADKVNTPLLLLHGDADTNVPVGESHQMYTALMLLNKDVELVEFQGDDHHINSRERRMRWWSTILAYFDMKLKEEPQWWEHLYPPVEEN